nr:MAG TPA: hypothetical protein [Crassvirales sp.]
MQLLLSILCHLLMMVLISSYSKYSYVFANLCL